MTPEELLRITTDEWIAAADTEELEQVVRAIGALPKIKFPPLERLHERAALIDRELNLRRLHDDAAAAERQHRDLLNHLKDSELRGLVLKFLYENRRTDFIAFGPIQGATAHPASIDLKDWLRACSQLADHGLIDWKPLEDHTGQGLLGGVAKINGFGTAVIEEDKEPPIPIVVDQRQYIQVTGSQAVQIAGAHSEQHQTITDAFGKVVTALDNANVSEAEKQKARSILITLLESKAAAAVLGSAAAGLIKLLGG
jgi:hypothetical protein